MNNEKIQEDIFIKENNLLDVGECPSNFTEYYFYLYHLVYPFNLKEYEMTKFKVSLIELRLIVIIFLLIIKIGFLMTLCFSNDKKILFVSLCIVFFVLLMIVEIFNVNYYIGKYYLNKILTKYNKYYDYVNTIQENILSG